MAREKFDNVVEAVRYQPDGKIELVRVYERRGAAWSDRVLLTRQQFIERLRAGKKAVIGQRLPLMGSSFETGPAIRLAGSKDAPVVVTGQDASDQDHLQGVPRF